MRTFSIHLNVTVLDEMETEDTIEDISESVDDLRERLTNVKRLMMEQSGYTLGDLAAKKNTGAFRCYRREFSLIYIHVRIDSCY